jgi:hypothetical protein
MRALDMSISRAGPLLSNRVFRPRPKHWNWIWILSQGPALPKYPYPVLGPCSKHFVHGHTRDHRTLGPRTQVYLGPGCTRTQVPGPGPRSTWDPGIPESLVYLGLYPGVKLDGDR